MSNAENITKVKRSPSEARKNGKKSGIASGKARRERKAMRELLEIALSGEVENKRTGEKMTRAEAATIALVSEAMKGNVPAYKTICEVFGENAPLKIDANVKQAQTTQVSFGDMDVEAMAVFLTDVKEQAQRKQEEQADE